MGILIQGILWIVASLSLMLLPFFWLYTPELGGFSFFDSQKKVATFLPEVWYYLDVAFFLLGDSLYFFPLAMVLLAWRFSYHRDWRISQIIFLTACMVWGYGISQMLVAGIFTLSVPTTGNLPTSIDSGGALGNIVSAYLLALGFSLEITLSLLFIALVFSISLMLWLPWLTLMEHLGRGLWFPFEKIAQLLRNIGRPAPAPVPETPLPEPTPAAQIAKTRLQQLKRSLPTQDAEVSEEKDTPSSSIAETSEAPMSLLQRRHIASRSSP